MAIFTVHSKADAATGDAVFVRDGFHFWAFVFGPLWLLVRGFWLELVVYLALLGALGFGLHAAHLPKELLSAFIVLGHLLLGLEAANLRNDRLDRKGLPTIGVVQGSRLDDAERRFFGTMMQERTAPAALAAGP